MHACRFSDTRRSGSETFYETFKTETTHENMGTYIENAFNINQLTKELPKFPLNSISFMIMVK